MASAGRSVMRRQCGGRTPVMSATHGCHIRAECDFGEKQEPLTDAETAEKSERETGVSLKGGQNRREERLVHS